MLNYTEVYGLIATRMKPVKHYVSNPYYASIIYDASCAFRNAEETFSYRHRGGPFGLPAKLPGFGEQTSCLCGCRIQGGGEEKATAARRALGGGGKGCCSTAIRGYYRILYVGVAYEIVQLRSLTLPDNILCV